MKTTEELFHESIIQYKNLITDATLLNDSMGTLPLNEILHRCQRLHTRQQKQSVVDQFIIDIMNDYGSDILEMDYIGEYQRTLDHAISCCDEVSLKVKRLRSDLVKKIKNASVKKQTP